MRASAIIDCRQPVLPGDSKKPPRPKPPNAGKGRKKGVPNKTTALLKDAILKAAAEAGGKDGLIGYLRAQAKKANAGPFLGLLGKILPMQVSGDPDNPSALSHTVVIEFVNGPGPRITSSSAPPWQ
jgi:hypothetical protein